MNSGSPTGARARWMAAGLLLLAFFAGALGGIAADRVLDTRSSSAVEPLPPRRGPDGGPRGAGPAAIFPAGVQLARELDLTPEQRQRIQAILAEERAKADSVLRTVRPILQARYDSSTQAVRSVLTEEQRARFDSLRENRRDRVRGRLPPRRGGGPGGP